MLMKIAATTIIVILAIAIGLASSEVQARSTLNIGLTRFEAVPLDNAVRLEWDTETELGTAGYLLKRGQNGSFYYLLDPNGSGNLFVSSVGGPSLGSNYSVIDDTAVNGESYTYQLIEVTLDGRETVQADHSVTAGVAPTNTPIVLGGNDGDGGGNPNNNTPTPEPTATETATQVATGTALPSPTIMPSATLKPAALPTVLVEASPTTRPPATRPAELVEASPTSRPPATLLPDTSGIAIAQALEEPLAEVGYPGTDFEGTAQELTAPTAASAVGQEENNDNADTSNENNSQPIIIGNNQSDDNSPVLKNTAESQESTSTKGVLAGRIYLWVALIAALVIFVAAVLGAILLYTRRRNRG